jgi:hypothetical protein
MNRHQGIKSRATHWVLFGIVAVMIGAAFLHGNLPSLSGPFVTNMPVPSEATSGPALPELLW